jgi:uncharacterized membrane protein YphA (DoxX/SURF4 family)
MKKTNTKKTFGKMKIRQYIFYLLAIVMLFLAIWFILSNLTFLVKNLNEAFGTKPTFSHETIQFDKQGFEKLNLLIER